METGIWFGRGQGISRALLREMQELAGVAGWIERRPVNQREMKENSYDRLSKPSIFNHGKNFRTLLNEHYILLLLLLTTNTTKSIPLTLSC